MNRRANELPFFKRGLYRVCAVAFITGLTFSGFGTTLAFAQPAPPAGGPAGPGQGAAAGTMVAAALETVGYHAQAQVLAQLSTQIGYLGALVYLGVILSVILTYGIGGNYRQSLWMLAGPPLFFFSSGLSIGGYENRVQANGAEWRFGTFHDDQKLKDRYIEVPGEQANVSFLFHHYNRLISETSQKLIEVLTQESMKPQMLFMARQRTYEQLFGQKLQDSGVKALAARFMVECATEIGDARTISIANADPEYPIAQKNAAIARYCARFPKKDKYLPQGPAMDFVYTLPAAVQGFTIPQAQHLDRHQAAPQRVSCEDLWRWTLAGGMIDAKRAFDDSATHNFDWYAWQKFGTQLWTEVINAVFGKVSTPEGVNQSRATGVDPCPPNVTAESIGQSSDQMGQLQGIIAGMMIRKMMTDTPSQYIFQRAASDADGVAPLQGAVKELSTDPQSRIKQFHRQKEQQFADARRYEAFALIHMLPYIQGFLLYALSVSYPFFCLLIIIPGQAGGFLTWMALWAWAKSWDVGWAAIMLADEIAWELLPKTAYFNPRKPEAFTSPVNLLEGAFAGDPAYSVATYWMLLATMVAGVPLISAHAILGAKKAIAGRLLDGSDGLKGLAEKFGGTAEDLIGSRQVAVRTQQAAQQTVAAEGARAAAKFNADRQRLQREQKAYPTQGPIAQQVDKAIGPEMSSRWDRIWGNTSKAIGQGLQSVPSGLPGADAAHEAGQAVEASGADSRARADAFYAPGGEAQAETDAANAQFDLYGEMQSGNIAANGGFLGAPFRAAMYAGVPVEDIPGVSRQRAEEMIMDTLGIGPDEDFSLVADPEMRAQLNEAYRQSVIDRAKTVTLGTMDGEAVMLGSIPTMSAMYAFGGPIGAYGSFRSNAGYVAGIRRATLAAEANELGYRAELDGVVYDQYMWEAGYDPRVRMAAEAEAYLSADPDNGRGGENFAIRVFSADTPFRIQRAMESRRTNWQFEAGRMEGTKKRWGWQPAAGVFQPLMWSPVGNTPESASPAARENEPNK